MMRGGSGTPWPSIGIVVLAMGLCAPAAAADSPGPEGNGIRFSGFGTLGVVHAEAPDGWGFRRDINQPANGGGTRFDIDSRIGLQVNYAPVAQFELVGQVVATRRAPYAKAIDSIEWAFVAYRPNADFTVRVGRVNLDQFLLSDYHNVGFAYLFARPPVEFYGSLPSALDGADIARAWNVGGTQWRAKAYVGRAYSGDLSADARTNVRPIFGFVVSREADGLLLRAGLSRATLVDVAPALRPLLGGLSGLAAVPVASVAAEADALRYRLDGSGTRVTFASIGLSYEWQDWQVTSELTRAAGHRSATFSAGYVGLGRRFGPVTVFGIASRIHTPNLPVATPDWEAALTPVLGAAGAQQAQLLGAAAASAANHIGANQQTLSLGAHWDIQPRLGLKVQWDHVRIGANGGRLWSNATLEPGHAEVASVALVFVF
ncbi:MAG: hypothetical protein ABI460_13820 [Caldimonas sp.]